MNKFNLLITVLFCSIYTCSFAQFGNMLKKVKKPKIGLNKKTTTSSNTPASVSPSVENNRNSDGSPKHDSESPIYKAYSKTKEGLMFIRGAVEGFEAKQNPEKAREDANKYLARTKEHLDFLNTESSEQNRAYLVTFNTEYKRLEDKHASKSKESDQIKYHEDRLKEYQAWIVSNIKLKSEDLEPTVRGYKKTRDAFKNEYPEAFENGNVQLTIRDVETFFETKIYQRVQWIDDNINRTIKEMYEVRGDQEMYILNADNYLDDLKEPLEKLAYYKKDLLEDLTSANELEAKINKETSMLEEYINSGKYAANLAKYKKEIIDRRLLRKGMSDSKIEAFAKSKLPSKYGKVIRVTVASTGWSINKNAFDIPTSKGLTVDYAVEKEDGKCYYMRATIGRTYEGGDTYGPMWFSQPYVDGEMNCNHVNKNK